MARIADEVIERIKTEVSLVRLAESQGYALVKHGKDFAVCCPFHADKTPSCVITPKSNLFNCFGCGAGGSVIDWVMKTQGVSFRHAVELLKNDIAAVTSPSAAKKASVPKLAAPVSVGADDQTVLCDVVNYYHETLQQAPEALAYLESRGLNDPELINHFKLGYANRTLGLRLPQKNRKAGAEMREKLQRLGVYRESGHEHLNGSLVVPLFNKSGDVVQLYGRKIRDDLREGTPKHLYLPGDHAGVFNYEYLKSCSVAHGILPPVTLAHPCVSEIILCEALIDALTFWRWGFKNVTSSYGVNGFTDEILQTLIELKIKRVLIAYDRDEGGNIAAEKVAKQLNENGIDAFRVQFPKGMDANQFALQTQPAQKALALTIRKAEWLGSGVVPEITTQLIESDHSSPLVAAVDKTEQLLSPEVTAEIKKLAVMVNALDKSASPVPPPPTSTVTLETRDDGLFITLGERTYRIRGLDKNASADQLKVQLMVQRGEAFFIDKLDLYASKQRQIFINQACVELGVSDEIIKKDLGKVLLSLEQEQLKKDNDKNILSPVQSLTNEEREAALNLLRDKNLPERILADFNLAGVVGEETNKLVGYLACVSRKLDRPLAVVIQSSSAAGKSSLMDAVLAFMPEDERVQYSAMTGQSLFYMGETRLKNKILAISEEEGAHTASYALKLLQSEGEVTIASTGKDDSSGQLVTREYKVEGPVMLFLTTTAIDIDEELLNRCLVLTVNESREQTEAIHHAQRLKRTLKGLESKIEKSLVLQLHRNAQRLLKPLTVINPYADQLTFLADKTRTRRDHEKYLTLIDSIALLHQYQREIKMLGTLEYIEVTTADIALANRLAHEVLGKTLDELPPQTRQLLTIIHRMVSENCKLQGVEQNHFRFSRKQIREFSGWGNTQLKIHCNRLEDMEYLLVHRGGRGQSFDYELLYQGEGEKGKAFVMGLVDEKLLQHNNEKQKENHEYDEKKSGQKVKLSGSSRPQVGGMSGQEKPLELSNGKALHEWQHDWEKGAYLAV
jgi:DNA primase